MPHPVTDERVIQLLQVSALACGVMSAAILIWYLVHRPPLTSGVRLVLLLGLGVLPIGVAFTGNLAGFESSKKVEFCNSCHVMQPFVNEAFAPGAKALAAIHSRNEQFRPESCYMCHSDYGIYGTVTTKLVGLRHFWAYYLGGYRNRSFTPGSISLYHPYSNDHCVRCHSGTLASFAEVPEHVTLKDEIARDEVLCANDSCHGPAHPAEAGQGQASRLPASAITKLLAGAGRNGVRSVCESLPRECAPREVLVREPDTCGPASYEPGPPERSSGGPDGGAPALVPADYPAPATPIEAPGLRMQGAPR